MRVDHKTLGTITIQQTLGCQSIKKWSFAMNHICEEYWLIAGLVRNLVALFKMKCFTPSGLKFACIHGSNNVMLLMEYFY